MKPSQAQEIKKNKTIKSDIKEIEPNSQHKTTPPNAINSRNQKTKGKFEGSKINAQSFSYQPSKALEKLTAVTTSKRQNDINNKVNKDNESNGKN